MFLSYENLSFRPDNFMASWYNLKRAFGMVRKLLSPDVVGGSSEITQSREWDRPLKFYEICFNT